MTIRDLAAIVRRIIGAPDYAAYLAHATACQPTVPPMDEQTFHQRQLELRYSRPGSRCC